MQRWSMASSMAAPSELTRFICRPNWALWEMTFTATERPLSMPRLTRVHWQRIASAVTVAIAAASNLSCSSALPRRSSAARARAEQLALLIVALLRQPIADPGDAPLQLAHGEPHVFGAAARQRDRDRALQLLVGDDRKADLRRRGRIRKAARNVGARDAAPFPHGGLGDLGERRKAARSLRPVRHRLVIVGLSGLQQQEPAGRALDHLALQREPGRCHVGVGLGVAEPLPQRRLEIGDAVGPPGIFRCGIGLTLRAARIEHFRSASAPGLARRGGGLAHRVGRLIKGVRLAI